MDDQMVADGQTERADGHVKKHTQQRCTPKHNTQRHTRKLIPRIPANQYGNLPQKEEQIDGHMVGDELTDSAHGQINEHVVR